MKLKWSIYWGLFGALFMFYGGVFGGTPTSAGLIVFFFVILALLIVGEMASIGAQAKEREEEIDWEKSELEKVRKLVEDHISTLSRKRRALTRTGDYGEIMDEEWRKEIWRFANVALPNLLYMSLGGGKKHAGHKLESFIDQVVSDHIDTTGASLSNDDVTGMSGIEYEAFCAELLEKESWQVQRTPATGDHGVDLLAEKPGRRVAIQCKKYSTPVGNKAVQEAYSGMKFFDAEEAVVVTNSTFTQAAQVLANKLSVALKHHDELVGL